MELKKEELLNIVGGINITASFVSAISKGINSLLELGRTFGTSIRRLYDRKLCGL